MDEITPAEPSKPESRRRWLIYGAVALACFLAGLVPMWLSARDARAQLREVQSQLREVRQEMVAIRLQADLGSAVVDARRGNYEPARQAVSEFYTRLREQLEPGKPSPFTQAQQARINQLLADRDKMVTLLARGDPASGERLSNLYVNYRQLVRGSPPANMGGTQD